MFLFKKYLFALPFILIPFSTSAQFWELFLEPIFVEAVGFVFVGSENEPSWQETTYASYPYDLRGSGLYLPTTLEGDQSRFNINLHFQNNESSISGGLFQLKYSPISLLTLEVNHLQLYNSEKKELSENSISLTSFSVIYNRLRHHKIHAWWGLGGIWMDADNNSGSGSFNMGLNYFIKEPISLYGDVQFSVLNNEFTSIAQVRMQIHLSRFLVYGGYHKIDSGNLQIGSWIIGGGVYF